jgi:hypothetical protein
MSMGLQSAGWEPIGIDISDHPLRYYPFPAYQYDISNETFPQVLNLLIKKHHPTLIVASPPCQGFGTLQNRNRTPRYTSEAHPPQNLVALVRNILAHTQIPFILENVPGAPLFRSKTIQLCGSSFGLRIRRHRLFECHLEHPIAPPPCEHDWQNRHKPYYQANGELTGIITVTGTSHAGTRLIPTQGRQPFAHNHRTGTCRDGHRLDARPALEPSSPACLLELHRPSDPGRSAGGTASTRSSKPERAPQWSKANHHRQPRR